ncbi:MAG: MBL fold metallo-hydrolase [Rhodospirillaceae bacterium]
MKTSRLFAAALLCAGFASVPVVASAADASMSAALADHGLKIEDFPRTHQLAPGVYAYEDTLITPKLAFTTNSLIVVTTDGVVLVDGQDNEARAASLVNTIKKLTPLPLKYVVMASDHRDHVGGFPTIKAAWPDAVYISSSASLKTMQGQNRPVLATELVDDKRVLTLGGTELQILNIGRGHTGGDLVVFLPARKVLFMSELYYRDIFPSTITGYPSEWLAALKKAQGMDATWYIPGHGFAAGTAAELKADFAQAVTVMELIVAEGKRLHPTGAPCPSEKDCPANAQAKWGKFLELTESEIQAPRALARMYAEIEGRLPK